MTKNKRNIQKIFKNVKIYIDTSNGEAYNEPIKRGGM